MPSMVQIVKMHGVRPKGGAAAEPDPTLAFYHEQQLHAMERARAEQAEQMAVEAETRRAEVEAKKSEAEARQAVAQQKGVEAKVSSQQLLAQQAQLEQESLYAAVKQSLLDQGYSDDQAEQVARRAAAKPIVTVAPAPQGASDPFRRMAEVYANKMERDLLGTVNGQPILVAQAPPSAPTVDPMQVMMQQLMLKLMQRTIDRLDNEVSGALGPQQAPRQTPFEQLGQQFQARVADTALKALDQTLSTPNGGFAWGDLKGLDRETFLALKKIEYDYEAEVKRAENAKQVELAKSNAVNEVVGLLKGAPRMIGEALAASAMSQTGHAQAGGAPAESQRLQAAECAACHQVGVYADPSITEQVVSCVKCGKPNKVISQ